MLRKTDARKRVNEELERRGLLLVEGTQDFPSVAGLQSDTPNMAGGFSWDSAPAHALARALAQERDVARLNLFRGKDTLVHRSLWPALNGVATFKIFIPKAAQNLGPILIQAVSLSECQESQLSVVEF